VAAAQGRSCETGILAPGVARGVTRAEASNTSLRAVSESAIARIVSAACEHVNVFGGIRGERR